MPGQRAGKHPDFALADCPVALFRLGKALPEERGGNFLREIGLNGKDIGQIAVVIFRPNVLVVSRVNQLHIHSHPIADPTYTPFQKRGNAQRLANFTSVANAIVTIGHDRHA